MTVTAITQKSDTRRPKLTCSWVPVRGADGRVRMEMRWAQECDQPTSSGAVESATPRTVHHAA